MSESVIIYKVTFPNSLYKVKPYSKKACYKNKYDEIYFADSAEAHAWVGKRKGATIDLVVLHGHGTVNTKSGRFFSAEKAD